jgi:hypothetical protein
VRNKIIVDHRTVLIKSYEAYTEIVADIVYPFFKCPAVEIGCGEVGSTVAVVYEGIEMRRYLSHDLVAFGNTVHKLFTERLVTDIEAVSCGMIAHKFYSMTEKFFVSFGTENVERAYVKLLTSDKRELLTADNTLKPKFFSSVEEGNESRKIVNFRNLREHGVSKTAVSPEIHFVGSEVRGRIVVPHTKGEFLCHDDISFRFGCRSNNG